MNKVNVSQYTFIMYSLGQRHLSQTSAAKFCGCSVQFVNQIILGKKKSKNIEGKLASFLGYRSWAYMQLKIQEFEALMIKGAESIC